jgi:hypothetical protein
MESTPHPYKCFSGNRDIIHGEHSPSFLPLLASKAPSKIGSAPYPLSPLGCVKILISYV